MKELSRKWAWSPSDREKCKNNYLEILLMQYAQAVQCNYIRISNVKVLTVAIKNSYQYCALSRGFLCRFNTQYVECNGRKPPRSVSGVRLAVFFCSRL